jgi:hypothetical protein
LRTKSKVAKRPGPGGSAAEGMARVLLRAASAGKGNSIECETRRGFHASLCRGDPCTQ